MSSALHAPPQDRAKLSRTAVIYGCIDIGSNTTRLLVARANGGRLEEMVARRAFTRIGRSVAEHGRISAEKIAETAEVVAAQAALGREAGATELVVVATAAIREAANAAELADAVDSRAGLSLRVLTGHEEARLCFLGATRTLPAASYAHETVAVADVGGGSTEVVVGRVDGQVEWAESLRVGSGLVADAHLHSDPPSASELDAARHDVQELFEGLCPPAATSAVAVGGTATSLHRLLGPELDSAALARGVDELAAVPAAEIAARYELDPERVRLLPAGILVLAAVSDCLGLPLRIARGGLREGVILELAGGA